MAYRSSSPPRIDFAWPALLIAATLLALGLGWVGYAASDDASYYQGALRWLTHPPYPGDDHWTTRFPLILSFAAALAIFGKGFTAFAVTALAWYVALITIVGLFTARIGGNRAGWIAAILVGTLPVIVGEASTVGCDLAEAFFLVAGAWLISGSIRPGSDWKRPVAAGLSFALAILCRETTALALLGFAPLFALGRPVPRRALILMGVAAACVLLGEMAFQWSLTGDPLRRYVLAFNHDSHIDRAANLEGNFLVHPAIDPLLVLLVNNDFALLFWLAFAALGSGALGRLDKARKRRLLIPAALAVAAFLLVSLLTTKLVLNPRYFMLPALVAAMLVALWLTQLKPWPRTLLLALAVATNLLMISVENGHPRWPAEAAVIAAAAHPDEAIFTDRETRQRADVPLRFAGLVNVRVGEPPVGHLYLAEETETLGPPPLARYAAPATPLGRMIEALGLARHLPAAIGRRLLQPGPTILLLRSKEKGPADRSTGPRKSSEPASFSGGRP
jgi:4-amino-4-deoxy-L-arabinose transferase-like glycosyltransferase